MCLSIFRFVFQPVCLKKLYRIAMKVYQGVQGGKGSKRLNCSSDLDHNPALAEVCSVQVLGIRWLYVDTWWWRSITGWLSERIHFIFFYLRSLTDKSKIPQSVTLMPDGGVLSLSASSCPHYILPCQYKLHLHLNTNYTSMSIQTILPCQYKLYFHVNTNYTSMLIQIILPCQYKLYFCDNINYTSMSVQTALPCQYKLYFCDNINYTCIYFHVSTNCTSMSIQTVLPCQYELHFHCTTNHTSSAMQTVLRINVATNPVIMYLKHIICYSDDLSYAHNVLLW